MDETLYSLTYTESHPDRDRTFLGIFSSEERAKVAMLEHMRQEKLSLPNAHIAEWDYSFDEAILDEGPL